MKIKVLGAHNLESRRSRCVSLLIDDVLALDAGALTSGLSFAAQRKLRAVVLTHQHYDHVRDIPALAINFLTFEKTIDVYATQSVRDVLSDHLLNGTVYPKFMENPPEKPPVRFNLIEPNRTERIAGYDILAIPVHHAVPTVGLQIAEPSGRSLFYTSDTGPGLTECWRQISPDLIIVEVTSVNRHREFASQIGHLTPSLLQEELESFRKLKDYLPQVLLVHMNPMDEEAIKAEIAEVSTALNTTIELGQEGMQIEL